MKPDQLIKRRGKLGLIKVNADYKTVQEWISQRMNKDQQVRYQQITSKINTFSFDSVQLNTNRYVQLFFVLVLAID